MRLKMIALIGTVFVALLCGCNDGGDSANESSFVKSAITNADSTAETEAQTEETTEAETIPRLETAITPVSEKIFSERMVITEIPKIRFEEFGRLDSRDESKIENTKED